MFRTYGEEEDEAVRGGASSSTGGAGGGGEAQGDSHAITVPRGRGPGRDLALMQVWYQMMGGEDVPCRCGIR